MSRLIQKFILGQNKKWKKIIVDSKLCLALVRATLVLWWLEMNWSEVLRLVRTVDNILMSRSPPWKPSIVFTFTSNPSCVSYRCPSKSWIATTWAAYGDTTPILRFSLESHHAAWGKIMQYITIRKYVHILR